LRQDYHDLAQEAAVPRFVTGLSLAALALVTVPQAAPAETRAAYLDRMRAICADGCLQPRHLLRTARRLPPDAMPQLSAIVDIGDVAVRGDTYVLLQRAPNLYDMTELDFGMPHLDQSPISDRNNIRIEMSEDTLFDLLNLPRAAAAPPAARMSGAGEEDAILVPGTRDRAFEKPSLAALKAHFRNRRIVVRGQPRLDVVFAGARLDRRHKQLTLMLASADDLVLLPRYDKAGNPVPDGALAGLAAAP